MKTIAPLFLIFLMSAQSVAAQSAGEVRLPAVTGQAECSNGVIATEIPADGLTAKELVAWLQSAGLTAHVDLDRGLDYHGQTFPKVTSYSNSHMFSVHLHDCKGDRCASLQFFTGMAMMNPHSHTAVTYRGLDTWNHTNRWTRATFTSGGGLSLEFDVALAPCGSYEQLNSEFAIWRDSLDRFYDFAEMGTLTESQSPTQKEN